MSPQAEDLASAVLTTGRASILDLSLGFVPALSEQSPAPALPAPDAHAAPPAAGAEADFSSSCGNSVCEDFESCSTCAQDCNRPNGRPCQRVSALYSVWHWCEICLPQVDCLITVLIGHHEQLGSQL